MIHGCILFYLANKISGNKFRMLYMTFFFGSLFWNSFKPTKMFKKLKGISFTSFLTYCKIYFTILPLNICLLILQHAFPKNTDISLCNQVRFSNTVGVKLMLGFYLLLFILQSISLFFKKKNTFLIISFLLWSSLRLYIAFRYHVSSVAFLCHAWHLHFLKDIY